MESLYPLCQIEIRNLPQVFFMEFIRGNGYKVNFQHTTSSSNGQANGTIYSNLRRHAMIVCFEF
jgi:hypothetical protein